MTPDLARPSATLEAIRIQALQGVQAGESSEVVAAALRIARPRSSKW